MTATDDSFTLPGSAHVGRVALRVASLDDVLPFYETLGFAVDRDDRVRLTAGGETLLVLREDPDAPVRRPVQAGLFHAAVRVPSRAALGAVLERVRESEFSLTGASDHLVSEALYFQDPEGNGIEVYRDRPRGEWPRTADGGVDMDTEPLDLADLADAATGDAGRDSLPAGTDVGHVHLEVTDLDRAEEFYVDGLGLGVQTRYAGEAAFLAAGDYHHHVGLNTWNRRREPAGDGRGLDWFEFVLPDGETVAAVRQRLDDRGYDVDAAGDDVAVTDPDGVHLRLTTTD